MTHKKVLVLMASPRARGNSTILAEEAAKGAKKAGATVEILSPRQVEDRPVPGLRRLSEARRRRLCPEG